MSDRRTLLRKQIQKTSKEAFILNEMKRLGFWPEDQEQPSLPEQIIQEETALNNDC